MYSVAETAEHDFILCGFRETIPGSSFTNAQLLKINGIGDIIQQRDLESEMYLSTFATVRKTISSADDFFLMGRKDSVEQNVVSHLFKLWRMDSNLNFTDEYSLNFSDSLIVIPQQYINLNDSLIYFLSGIIRPPSTRIDFSVTKLNLSDGTYRMFSSSWYTSRVASNIIFDTIGQQLKVLIAGAATKSNGIIRILTFDMDLNYISDFEPDFVFGGLTCRMANYSDDSYILLVNDSRVSGETCLSNIRYSYENVFQNKTDVYCSADTLTYPGSGNSMLKTDSIIWSIGIYNIDPSTFWQPTPTWIQVSRINADFELTDQYYYGGDGLYFPYDIISTSDGGMLIAGNYYNPNAIPLVQQRDPFVLKLNSEGLIVNVDNPEQPISQEAIVLPNPGKEYLQVKLAIQHKTARFQLFDTGGRQVLETDLSGDMQRVKTEQLPSGVYIYRITGSNLVIGSGKWVKE